MWIVGLIAGAIVGAVAGESGAFAGAFVGAVAGLAWSLSRRQQAETRLDELERRLAAITARLVAMEQGRGAGAPAPAAAQHAEDSATAPAAPARHAENAAAAPVGAAGSGEPPPALPVRDDRAHAAAISAEPMAPVTSPAPATAESAAAAEAMDAAGDERLPASPPSRFWQWLTGGNPFVRVGVVVLFFGVAFLLRYAAEHVRFPIELRLAAVAAGAIGLLAIGWWLRVRRAGYALILQGGAIGVLFLTVFASFRLYGLLPGAAAFLLLIALAAFGAVLAVAQDSRALAVAAVSGGFLAPVLASSGSGSHVMLFGYYLVLDAAILAIAWFKAWRILNVVGFGFTFVIGTLWGANFYRPELFASTEPFLIAFFLLYVAIAVLFARRQAAALRNAVDGTLVFGTPLVAFVLQARLVDAFELGAAYSAVAAAAFYLLLARWLHRRGEGSLQLLCESFLALGVVFATLTVPLAFDARVTAASWALEGAAIVWVSARQRRKLGQAFGALLQLAAGFAFMLADAPAPQRMPWLNSAYLGALMIALGGLYSARTLARLDAGAGRWRRAAGWILLAWGALWWTGAGVMELDRVLDSGIADHAILVFLLATCLGFSVLNRRLAWNEARFVAYAWLPFAYLGALVDWDELRHPFAHAGWLAWPAVFGLHFVLLARHEGDRMPARACHAAGLWLLCALLAWELGWAIGELVQGASVWRAIAWAVVPAAVLWVLAMAGARIRWPVAANQEAYLLLGAAPLAAALFAWTVGVNFVTRADAAPLPYLPLANPLDLAQVGAFLGIAAWLVQLARQPFGTGVVRRRAVFLSIGAAAVFVWLNAVLLRTLHHWAGVPFGLAAMLDSMLVQASLSIFWTLIALCAMVYATRRRQRLVWMAGAGLMAVVTAKLFFVDLSNVGGVERIVSFMAVGLLLLVVGYFSPVPPKRTS